MQAHFSPLDVSSAAKIISPIHTLDVSSAAKIIFPKFAQVSLLAGYSWGFMVGVCHPVL